MKTLAHMNRYWSAVGLVAISLYTALFAGCSQSKSVIVYTSQDQIFAEPILAEFTKQTGIKVLPIFDSESVKTAGLVQRLIAEKENPRADIFWSNEELMARELVGRGVLDSNRCAFVGSRTRRLVINTNKISVTEAPKSFRELTEPKWRGKVAMAYPLYGTTAAHMTRLREAWGDEKWKQWCRDFVANNPFIVDGNSVVVKLVGAGEAWIGMTDSDDIAAGQRNGYPIVAGSIPQEFNDEYLRIPNTVAFVAGARHPEAAQAFFEFVQSSKALDELVRDHALESATGGSSLSSSRPFAETRDVLKTIFVRE